MSNLGLQWGRGQLLAFVLPVAGCRKYLETLSQLSYFRLGGEREEIIIFWVALRGEERLLGRAINLGVSTFLLLSSNWPLDWEVGGCYCVASGCGVK